MKIFSLAVMQPEKLSRAKAEVGRHVAPAVAAPTLTVTPTEVGLYVFAGNGNK